jgi:FtsH-binding integral membrane protein
MANGLTRGSNGADARRRRRPATDAGLRSYMLSVYNYMASGVLLTGIVAMLFARSGGARCSDHQWPPASSAG